MNDKLFDSPVFVKGGNFTIVEIASLRDAIDFLEEWPVELKNLPYETILRACYSALDGSHPLSSVRDNFAKWAKAANILEDLPSIPAWMTGPRSGLRRWVDIYPAFLSGEDALALNAAMSMGPTEN